MGGGGIGGITKTIDVKKLADAANQRIKDAFSPTKRVIFFTDSSDRLRLEERIEVTDALEDVDCLVVDEEFADWERFVRDNFFIVIYSGASQEEDFLNEAAKFAVSLKKEVIFTPGNEDSITPNYVTQLRIRALFWAELIEILRT